nr:immunoglobulin light chain junction region [Macaca mulatta]MOW02954.1 immunoglobulin light chain junction region [Macaca mulatta]MOW03222.1 immunoglobulin light chain junction region [Macaca mulatta]MOW03347.1 immunoglobulin light chain junction region [Macaca mulatta]MOW03913.1 immunoglobulin light chain junction region [Macaca mulatta]
DYHCSSYVDRNTYIF